MAVVMVVAEAGDEGVRAAVGARTTQMVADTQEKPAAGLATMSSMDDVATSSGCFACDTQVKPCTNGSVGPSSTQLQLCRCDCKNGQLCLELYVKENLPHW